MSTTDLVWLLTRSNSSFLVKRNNTVFSRDPASLTNKHAMKYSGASAKQVSISSKDSKALEVILSKPRKSIHKVSALKQKNVIKKPFKSTVKKVVALVKPFRPDLVNEALLRTMKLLKKNTLRKNNRRQKK
jgi:hypothetical protein